MDNNEKYAVLIGQDEYTFDDIVRVLDALLGPDGCPWDREQTHDSLKRYLIEEAYETLEAIDAKDDALLCEELGDVLFEAVFHAMISKSFTIGDVIGGVCKKMISRHPHVFGSVVAETSEAVLENWENIKRREKGLTGYAGALKRVPANLPALMRAYKVQQKARDAGFDWDDAASALAKVEEELAELRRAMEAAAKTGLLPGGGEGTGDARGPGADSGELKITADIGNEMGDLFFAAANVSRLLKVHPELALKASTDKFIRRFDAMEQLVTGEGRDLSGMSLAQMDVYWDRVKAKEP